MFDFLRNLTKTEAEKQQETLSAYLDNALTSAEREKFEAQLSSDTTLRASLEQQRQIKENVGQLPRLRAPRNFTLDPAAYGRPASDTAFRLYPVMQGATALAAVLLIFLFSLQFFSLNQQDTVAQAPSAANGVSEEAADTTFDEDAAEEPAPAAVPEIMSEENGEVAANAEEAAEEAMEEEAEEEMEEAEEEAMAPPAEPEPAEETPAEESGDAYLANPTEQPLGVTGEAETEITGGDGSVTTQSLTPTLTLRSNTTTTQQLYSTTDPGSNQQIPTVEPGERGLTGSTPIPPLRLLQIGLGILFLVLLTATWLLRRQL